MQVARIVQMHDHRMIGRTPFDLENLAHCGRVGSIRTESIDRLGGEHHQIAGAQGFNGRFDFCLSSSYHAPMISRLRCQQRSLTRPRGRSVPQCRFCPMGAPLCTSNGGKCRRKDTLHEYQIKPAPELESHLVKMAYGGEPKAAM